MGLYCKAYIYIIVIVIKNSDYVNRLKSLRFDIQKCIYAITEQTFTLKVGIISPLTPFVLCSLWIAFSSPLLGTEIYLAL